MPGDLLIMIGLNCMFASGRVASAQADFGTSHSDSEESTEMAGSPWPLSTLQSHLVRGGTSAASGARGHGDGILSVSRAV